jgi:hypothetical protein
MRQHTKQEQTGTAHNQNSKRNLPHPATRMDLRAYLSLSTRPWLLNTLAIIMKKAELLLNQHEPKTTLRGNAARKKAACMSAQGRLGNATI